MWLLLSAIYVAFLGLSDVVIDLIAVNYYRVDVIILGLLNSLWILTYIISSRIASRIAENKGSRPLIVISILAMLSFFVFLFSLGNFYYLIISEILHSLSVALVRNGVSITILNNLESEKWDNANRAFFQSSMFFEGVFLYGTSVITLKSLINSVTALSAALLAVGVFLLLLMPSSNLSISRDLFRVEKSVNSSLSTISILSSIGYEPLYAPSKARVVSRILESRYTLTVGDVLVSVVGFRLSNSFFFTPLAFILLRILGLSSDSALAIYGVAKIVASISLSFFPNYLSRKLAVTILMVRFLVMALLVSSFLTRSYELIAALTLTYLFNIVLDAKLYSLYIEASLASNPSTYSVVSEFSNIV
ncbi:MAG: hypothetical protein ACP5KB_06685, partial [Thermoprotei archaeon]